MIRSFAAAVLCAWLFGCSARQSTVLGVAPATAALTAVRELRSAPASVTVHGVMTEKCPVAGCWFMLRDKTGVIKVDTKAAGFTVIDVPLNTELTVSGRLATSGERMIAATGLRY